ncbi:DUF2382 domain-containing protein [Deinococcus apachensis]|uniref:DUF2382 domain-containing protein n=1 Tax=Deinococcus apachensis TaxID=309886 RepID=UPI00035F5711|nr:DUF2382 domain-containing protein [Deinococcus apachensis]
MDEQDRIRQATQETRTTETTELREGNVREVVERLRLHEERALVEVVPENVGAVTVRRVVREREEVVPITLHSEHLEITVQQDTGGRVTMNGETLEVGRTYEVPLYEERALVEKRVYPFSDVTISKQARTYTQTERLTLRREELDVEDPQGLIRDRTVTGGTDPQP